MIRQIVINLHDLNLLSITVRLLLAVICAGFIGIERRRKKHAAGFRTYILVCLGAAIVVLTNLYLDKTYNPHADPARLGAQVINGIGFLGIGSIIVSGSKRVKGLTTAAGLWSCACIGLAIGAGFYEVAVLGSSLIFISMTVLHNIESKIDRDSKHIDLFIEVDEKNNVSRVVNYLRSQSGAVTSIHVAPSKDPNEKNTAVIVSLKFKERFNHYQFVNYLMKRENVLYVSELEDS